MTATPGELTATSVIGLIESGAYPPDVVTTIARGFLPLEQNDLIAVLAYLAGNADHDIASLARGSLGEIPGRALFDFAASDTSAPEHLMRLLMVADDQLVLEALIRNRAVTDDAISELAERAAPAVQDVIVINQARILRAPQILDALLANPELSPDVRRRVLETREEFFDKKARLEQAEADAEAAAQLVPEEEVILDIPLDPIADLLEKAAVEDEQPQERLAAAAVLSESERRDDKRFAIWARLQFMSVSEKVQLAFKGDRMVRMFLVRERNKLICNAVMRNPRMSENEVEAIAGMRNVEDEVLRTIGNRRDWMQKYTIMTNLIRNPKTPVGVVLPLINRLTLRDLKGLKDDKGVSAVVREMAKKFYIAKSQKNG